MKQDKKSSKDRQYVSEFKCVFHKCNTKKEIGKFFPFYEVAKNSTYVQDGKIRVELKFIITTVQLSQYPHYDFNQPTESCDGKILVENHIFNINKKYLAMHSDYFDKMFFSDFKEKNADVIELKDVNHKLFGEFLQVIYPSRKKIDKKRVQDMLLLADRYHVPTLTGLCEDFLLSRDCHFTAQVKLKLSDKYNLIRLQTTLLRKMDDEVTVKKAKGIAVLSEGLKAAIARKSLSVKDTQKTKPKAEADNRMEVD
ncbi:BTB/POZ domain-containing protein [Ditylenchus destructor]|nr:BTB/POZ domain-containing protein [Ditylenchus destructor]